MEVLGKQFRDDLLERFAQLQLIPYEKVFRPGKKFCDIEHLSMRFDWFKKLLKVTDAVLGNVFPVNWCLSYHLYREFARRSRIHLHEVLTGLEQRRLDPQAHVEILLKALKYIYTYETELRATWVAAAKLNGNDEESIEYDLKDSMGDAFDLFLGPYIMIERQNLEDMMAKLLKEEEANPNAGAVTRTIETFDSSRKMFEYIKSSLKRCTMFSSGTALISLSKEFRMCLQNYADSLRHRCPAPTAATDHGEPVYDVSGPQEVLMCRIVNTAEYCGDVVPQLESMLKQLAKPALVSEVNFAPEVDKFMDLIAFTIGVMVAGAVQKMENSFRAIRKINWSNVDSVGDDSPYVKDIRVVLNVRIPRVRDHISAAYFRNFCTKMATSILANFQSTVLRLKRVSKTAGGQLLLDLNSIKELMLRLPLLKFPENGQNKPTIQPSYTAVVRAAASKVEVILKLVCVDEDILEMMFKDLWPDGTESDLMAIRKIKGMGDVINPLNIDDPLYNNFRHELDQGVYEVKRGVQKIGGSIAANPVGKGIKSGVAVVGSGVKVAATGVVGGISNVVGGGGKQLDVSRHSDESQKSMQSLGVDLSVIADDFKHAFGGMKSFMGSGFSGGSAKKK